MKINLLTQSGISLGEAIQKILNESRIQLDTKYKSIASDALLYTTKNHINVRFPGSHHWNPDKVTTQHDGSIDIAIAGASRAYNDITIRPVHAKFLAIPVHAAAYGKKPADFNGLFKPKGKNALFMKKGNGIIAMFALAKQAFQKQDETLLPTDETYSENISLRLYRAFENQIEAQIRTI